MKVFAIFTYGSDDCRMLVNSTDCSSAVHLALTKTDIRDFIIKQFNIKEDEL